MNEPELLITDLLKKKKPYLIEIEQLTRALAFGTIELVITVRAGEVEKMEFKQSKIWLKPKLDVT